MTGLLQVGMEKEIALEFFNGGGEVQLSKTHARITDCYSDVTLVLLSDIDWLDMPSDCNKRQFLAYLASENLLEGEDN